MGSSNRFVVVSRWAWFLGWAGAFWMLIYSNFSVGYAAALTALTTIIIMDILTHDAPSDEEL